MSELQEDVINKSVPECGLYIVMPDAKTPEDVDRLAFQLRQALLAANKFSTYYMNRHVVEYRPFEGEDDKIATALLYKNVAQHGGFIFLIYDDVLLAREVEADGVLCSSIKHASEARTLLSEDKIVGLHCSTQTAAQSALALELDFVSFFAAKGGDGSLNLLNWWTSMSENPAAIEGQFDQENCEAFVRAGATFIQADHHIWTHPSGNVMQGVVNMLDAFERFHPQPTAKVFSN
jgi:thiamine monophosphate synthase